MELPEITDEDRKFLHYNPNTDDVIAWIQNYTQIALAEKEKEITKLKELIEVVVGRN